MRRIRLVFFFISLGIVLIGCVNQDNDAKGKAEAKTINQTVNQKEKKNDEPIKEEIKINEKEAEEQLLIKSKEIYGYLLENDWKNIHDLIHPKEGLTITFNRILDSYREFPIPTYVEDPTFSKFDFLDFIQQNEPVFWGFSATNDHNYFYMSISDYINNFLLKHCENPQVESCKTKLDYSSFSYEKILPIRNDHTQHPESDFLVDNIRTEIPNSRFVELFSPATENNNDWQKLRFVFLQHENEWYLRAIIRHVSSFDEH